MHNEVKEEHTCAICLSVYYQPIKLKRCTHIFCEFCIEETASQIQKKTCPLCRTPFRTNQMISNPELQEQIMELYPNEVKEKLQSLKAIKKYRIEVGNTTVINQVKSINKYQWTLFVKPAEGEAPLEKYADRVQVLLHPTFNPSSIMFPATEQIKLRRFGWGTFRIDIRVFWLKKYGGGFSEFYHDLQFEEKVSKVEVCRLQPKK